MYQNNNIEYTPEEILERQRANTEINIHESRTIRVNNNIPLTFTPCTGEIDLTGASYLLDPLIEAATITLIYGEPKVGKSYVGMHMAESMALRIPWMGMKTMTDVDGKILWLDLDMGHFAAYRRMIEIREGLKIQYSVRNEDFSRMMLMDRSDFRKAGLSDPDFYSNSSVSNLQDFIREQKVKVCFIDHLSKIKGNAEENSSGDMTTVFRNLDIVKETTGCAFVIIHHSCKTGSKARGSSAINAEPDLVLGLYQDGRKEQEGLIRLDIDYARFSTKRSISMVSSFARMCNEDGSDLKDHKGRDMLLFQLRENKEINTGSDQALNLLQDLILREIKENPGRTMNKFAEYLHVKYPKIAGSTSSVKNNINKMLDMVPPLLIAKPGSQKSKVLYSAEKKTSENSLSES